MKVKSLLASILLTLVYNVSAQDCPLPLTPHTTTRTTDGGITTTTAVGETPGGIAWNGTYNDNRHDVGYELWLEGVITATNTDDVDRNMKYHLSIPLYYTPMDPDELNNACYEPEPHEVVVRLEFLVPAGQTVSFEWDAFAKFPDNSQGADFNGDYVVDSNDLGMLYVAWGTDDPFYDLDGDGIVGSGDLGILLSAWTDTSQ